MLLSNSFSFCSRNRSSKPEDAIDPSLGCFVLWNERLLSPASLIRSGGRVGESGEVVIAAAVRMDNLPLLYMEPTGIVGEEKPSEMARVMASVTDELTLDGGIEGTLSPEGNELTLRPTSWSDLCHLPSWYDDPNWLESLCGAFQASQDDVP